MELQCGSAWESVEEAVRDGEWATEFGEVRRVQLAIGKVSRAQPTSREVSRTQLTQGKMTGFQHTFG